MKLIENAELNLDTGHYDWEIKFSDAKETEYIEAWSDDDDDLFRGTRLYLITDWDLKTIVNYIKKAHECGLRGEELHIERNYRET